MGKFYRASLGLALVAREVLREEAEMKDKAYAISRREGGSRNQIYIGRTLQGNLRVLGFRFNQEPNPKLFVPLKGIKNAWRPNKSFKAGRKLQREIEALECQKFPKIMRGLGLKFNADGEVLLPGIQEHEGNIYIEVPEGVVPEGCVEVTPSEAGR